MSIYWKRFRTAATVLWVLVAVLLAYNIRAWFLLSPRQFVFVLAAATGIVLLAMLNWPTRKKVESRIVLQLPLGEVRPIDTSAREKSGISVQTVSEVSHSQPAATSDLFSPGLPDKLSSEQAREWLDDFLRKQQYK